MPREWPRGPLVELWYAVHLPHGWSAPERVLAADRIDWGADHGAVALDRRGTPHLAVPIQSRANHPELTYLKREGGRWRETSFARIASYASLATAGDSVVIAFVGTRTGLRHDVNSLFVIRSPDGGESWKPAVLVPGSGPGLAYSPVLSAGADGILHLVWREITPQDRAGLVRHVRSGLGTDNWTETENWSIPHETLLQVTAVAAPCGEMVAFVESLGAEGIAVRELRSRGGALRESRLFPGAAGVAHVGAVHTDGVFRLVASVLEPNSQSAVSVRAQRPMCP